MSEQNEQPFRSREEELQHLGQELADIREALRDILGCVNQSNATSSVRSGCLSYPARLGGRV
jgi:hypothetical protein